MSGQGSSVAPAVDAALRQAMQNRGEGIPKSETVSPRVAGGVVTIIENVGRIRPEPVRPGNAEGINFIGNA